MAGDRWRGGGSGGYGGGCFSEMVGNVWGQYGVEWRMAYGGSESDRFRWLGFGACVHQVSKLVFRLSVSKIAL